MNPEQIKISYPKPTLTHSLLRILALSLDGQTIEIETDKKFQEIAAALEAKLDRSRFITTDESKYKGLVSGTTFEISWNWGGCFAGWLPVLYGAIEESPGGSKIKAHFDLYPFTKVFMIFWMFGALCIGAIVCSIHCYAMMVFMLGLVLAAIFGEHLMISTGAAHREKLIELLKQIA